MSGYFRTSWGSQGRRILKRMDVQQYLSLVYDALRRVNEIRPPEEHVPEEPDVVLVGDDGLLDSLALTILILSLENRLREKTGEDVSLMQEADLDALSEQFRTPRAIAELIAGKL
jgi:acyl carrier protein